MDLTIKMKMRSLRDGQAIEFVSKPLVLLPDATGRVVFQANPVGKTPPGPPANLLKSDENQSQSPVSTTWYGNATPVDSKLSVEVIDNKHSARLLMNREYRFQTPAPKEILEMSPLVYETKARKLVAKMSARPEFEGTSPATVRLRIPVRSNAIPDSPVVGVGGNLLGQLAFDKNSSLQIVASPVRLDPLRNGSSGRIYFDLDRYDRAFVYQNRWIVDSERDLFPLLLVRPEISMVTAPVVRNGEPIRIKFEPVNEPEGCIIILECVETKTDSDSPAIYRFVQKFATSREERFAVAQDEATGTFKILNAQQDWTYEMPTTGLVGKVSLKASLLDRFGKVLANDTAQVLLDDQLFEQAELIDVPEFVKVGSKLKVRLQMRPPASGVKQVLAVLGPVKDRKIPENASQVLLIKEDAVSAGATPIIKSSLETWSAFLEIPVKPELVGRSMITVILTTGAGLTQEVTGEVEIKKADFVDSGMIQGSVFQGSLSQAELPVVLRKMDAKRTEVARTKTDKQGQFQMSEIAPGKYGIFTAKALDQTSAQAEVVVKPGESTVVRLRLGRVHLPSNGAAPKAEAEPVK